MIGCAYCPVAVDIAGVFRLSNALTLIRDRLERSVNDKRDGNCNDDLSPLIVSDGLITIWHFGADSSVEYTGERF